MLKLLMSCVFRALQRLKRDKIKPVLRDETQMKSRHNQILFQIKYHPSQEDHL
jgi:hypothetical protein